MAPAPSSIFAQLNIIIDQNGASYCIITPTYSKCVIAARKITRYATYYTMRLRLNFGTTE